MINLLTSLSLFKKKEKLFFRFQKKNCFFFQFKKTPLFYKNKIFENMPIQLSTILYISKYREKSLSGYNVSNVTGYTRFNKGDKVQKFNITAFYPIDKLKSCYRALNS